MAAKEECPVSALIEIAVLQKDMKDVLEDVKSMKTDIQNLKDERASVKAWAAGAIATVTFIVVGVNAIASSSVVSKVQDLIDRRPAQGPVR